MFDLWAFLLQTLTASGVSVLLLAVKELFRDKLPPKWHFAIWGILGIILLIPTGIGGRYVLFNWALVVETLKTMLSGEYTFTRVLFPFPVLSAVPKTIFDWLFAVYFLGVIFHLIKYALSYIRLRSVLRQGWDADKDLMAQINGIAAEQKVKIRKVVTVPGLPSAFVCGVFRPVLALPADTEIDDKILLHELLHLRQKDTVWSIVICILRSVHWCNPLLVYCAKRAGNDLEARCDQRVLEQLEGEDRRDYGMILLSMTNDRFARTPGATCVNNGGRNIRRRIEAIARFKLYPTGMELVAVCAAIILAVPMILGVEATQVYDVDHNVIPPQMAFASARAVHCTTPAGAFDAYSKAILTHNSIYRAMCAPVDQQAALVKSVMERLEASKYPYWDIGIDSWPNEQAGYCIYNLRQVGEEAYEGMLVFELNYRPDGRANEYGTMIAAYQNLRVEKEGQRWVAIPLEEIQWMETIRESINWGIHGLPGCVYSATASDIRVDVTVQTIYSIDNTIQSESDIGWLVGYVGSYDTIPRPHTDFDQEQAIHTISCTHLGSQSERNYIQQIGISTTPVRIGEERPNLTPPYGGTSSGSSNNGSSWCSRSLDPGWGPSVELGGGGSGNAADLSGLYLPDYYAADLYINSEKAAELNLTLQEGGPQ